MTAALLAALAAALAVAVVRGRRLDAEREAVARAVHEARGPLTAVSLGLHAAARRGELPPTALAALELELRRAGLALRDLRGDGPDGAAQDVDLDALLAAQVAAWGEVAAARGRRLRLALDGRAEGRVVRGDAVRLAQAVGNVLANAVEHGGRDVEVRVVGAGNRVRVEVRDDGPGLPAPVADLVARPRAGRGTRGRGLAIATQVAARHGGRLRALPVEQGTCLALELPAGAATAR